MSFAKQTLDEAVLQIARRLLDPPKPGSRSPAYRFRSQRILADRERKDRDELLAMLAQRFVEGDAKRRADARIEANLQALRAEAQARSRSLDATLAYVEERCARAIAA